MSEGADIFKKIYLFLHVYIIYQRLIEYNLGFEYEYESVKVEILGPPRVRESARASSTNTQFVRGSRPGSVASVGVFLSSKFCILTFTLFKKRILV